MYISALGYYVAYCNGKTINLNHHELDPNWTDYNQTILYSSYDITPLLNGNNNTQTIGIMLGNGWYNPLPMRFWGSLNLRDWLVVGNTPKVILQVNIYYQDGTYNR